jgi:hypothetical protein
MAIKSQPSSPTLHNNAPSEAPCPSGNHPRIVYIRDIGISTAWTSTLVEALQAVLSDLQRSIPGSFSDDQGPIALILGLSPPVSVFTGSLSKSSTRRHRGFSEIISSTSDTNSESSSFNWGENEESEVQRESRTRSRIKQWHDETLLGTLISTLGTEVSVIGSDEANDISPKHGQLRFCIVMPDHRDKPEERLFREKRRTQLNIVRIQLAFAAAGRPMPSNLNEFSTTSQELRRELATTIIDATRLSQVVDRTLTPHTMASTARDNEAEFQVSWTAFGYAWDAYNQYKSRQTSWMESEINENSFDEVFQRVKNEDLSEHETALLKSVINPG